jgi:hypothetical protein
VTQHVLTAFLEPLTEAYGEPGKSEHVEGFFRQYARILQQYTTAELEAARDRVLKSHQPGPGRRWPSLPDCVNACEDARAAAVQLDRLKSSGSARVYSWLERERLRKEDEAAWSDEAKIIANQLVKSPMGRLAAEEGWILGLHDFCRRHRRLPDPYKDAKEIERLKEGARYVDDCLAGKIDMGLLAAQLRKMALSMRAKREDLRRAVLKEDEPC